MNSSLKWLTLVLRHCWKARANIKVPDSALFVNKLNACSNRRKNDAVTTSWNNSCRAPAPQVPAGALWRHAWWERMPTLHAQLHPALWSQAANNSYYCQTFASLKQVEKSRNDRRTRIDRRDTRLQPYFWLACKHKAIKRCGHTWSRPAKRVRLSGK